MKKIIIICSIMLSGSVFADQSENPFIYEEEPLEITAVGDAPAAPGDPGAVPVDQYIPFLLIAAAAITFTYGRRNKTA